MPPTLTEIAKQIQEHKLDKNDHISIQTSRGKILVEWRAEGFGDPKTQELLMHFNNLEIAKDLEIELLTNTKFGNSYLGHLQIKEEYLSR